MQFPGIYSSHTSVSKSIFPNTISVLLDNQDPVPNISTITRCLQCKCYINPYVEIISPGKKWRCNLCLTINDLSTVLNRTKDIISTSKTLLDNYQNNKCYDCVELNSLNYEVIAPPNYVLRAPNTPHLVFMIENTESSVKNNSVDVVLHNALDFISGFEEKVRFCILFYNTKVNILNRDGTFTIVSDIENIPPLLQDDFFFKKGELIDFNTLDEIKELRDNEQHLLNATRLATVLLSQGGTIYSFISSMPTTTDYTKLGHKMAAKAICFNCFLFPSVNVNLHEFYSLVQNTGGMVFYYPNFNGSDTYFVGRFSCDLNALRQRGIYNDAICRIRGSSDVKIDSYHGNFTMREGEVLAFGNFNPCHSIMFEYSVKQNIDICFQAAILRTVKGRRVIRVLNFMIPFINGVNPFLSVNLNIMAAHLGILAMKNAEAGREFIYNRIRKIIKEGRDLINLKETSHESRMGIENVITTIPLFALALSKTLPLRPSTQTPPDYRTFYTYLFTNMSLSYTSTLVHPSLLPIHLLQDQEYSTYVDSYSLSLTIDSLEQGGLYLLDTGVNIFFFDNNSKLDGLLNVIADGRFIFNSQDELLNGLVDYLMQSKPMTPNFVYIYGERQSVFKDIFMSYMICDRNNGMMGYSGFTEKINK